MSVYGCEPRVDYSACSEHYQVACPTFYKIMLSAQLIPFVLSLVSLVRDGWKACHRLVAPHDPPPLRSRIARRLRKLKKDTVLQMRIGTLIFTFFAVVHHAALLTPMPMLPPLLVEYTYNFYNIFLIATSATTLRYWQEFGKHIETMSLATEKPKGMLDRLITKTFTWGGTLGLVAFTSCLCLTTDTMGMLSGDLDTWHLAVRMQHFMFAFICSLIALGFIRIGKLQEAEISVLLTAQARMLTHDESLLKSVQNYMLMFRISYVLNAVIFVACLSFCWLGGIFFDTFYEVRFWIFLFSVFNLSGLVFAAVCFILASVHAREMELRLHDLLMYCNDLRRANPQEAESRRKSARASAVNVPDRSNYTLMPSVEQKQKMCMDKLFHANDYPCYVMPLDKLMCYDRLPTHEQALQHGALEILDGSSYYPCRSYCFFVSQEWLSQAHPDGDEDQGNPKLQWMKLIGPTLLGEALQTDEITFWMDIFSVPQTRPRLLPGESVPRVHPQTLVCQKSALHALPQYAFMIGRFLPLVRNTEGADTYMRRGWCQTECLCALTPKMTQFGEWRIGPSRAALRFHMFGDEAADGKEAERKFNLDTLRNVFSPEETDFTVESDRQNIRNVLLVFADQMDLYEQSGAHSWDQTCTIEARPQWLRELTEEPKP